MPFRVKDNQPGLHQALHEAFVAHAENSFSDPTLKHFKRVERGHGRDDLAGLLAGNSLGEAISRAVEAAGPESTAGRPGARREVAVRGRNDGGVPKESTGSESRILLSGFHCNYDQ